jgi:putative hemolysin
MEDLLEEIVGEILDEYDEGTPEDASAPVPIGIVLVPGSASIREINDEHGLELPTEDYTTVGGVVFGALGRLPVVGDRVRVGGASLTVRAVEGRRVGMVALEKDKGE